VAVAPVAAAMTAAGCPAGLLRPLLQDLVGSGRVRGVVDARRGVAGGLALADHRPQLEPAQSAARDQLLAALAQDLFRPPDLAGAVAQARVPPALLAALEAGGDLVRVGPDLAFHPRALAEAADHIRAAGRPLTLSEIRELLATTRKFAIPLMEELDRRGLTRRRGDLREPA
jgi:selenocysteine-specific elongation factor